MITFKNKLIDSVLYETSNILHYYIFTILEVILFKKPCNYYQTNFISYIFIFIKYGKILIITCDYLLILVLKSPSICDYLSIGQYLIAYLSLMKMYVLNSRQLSQFKKIFHRDILKRPFFTFSLENKYI